MILAGQMEVCPCHIITWSVLWSNPGHGSLCYQYAQRQSAWLFRCYD